MQIITAMQLHTSMKVDIINTFIKYSFTVFSFSQLPFQSKYFFLFQHDKYLIFIWSLSAQFEIVEMLLLWSNCVPIYDWANYNINNEFVHKIINKIVNYRKKSSIKLTKGLTKYLVTWISKAYKFEDFLNVWWRHIDLFYRIIIVVPFVVLGTDDNRASDSNQAVNLRGTCVNVIRDLLNYNSKLSWVTTYLKKKASLPRVQ